MAITVASGVTSSGLTISKGDPLAVSSGGVAEFITVLSGGSATLSAGSEGSYLTVSSGGTLAGPGALFGVTSVAGTISGVTLYARDEFETLIEVQSGGVAESVTLSGSFATLTVDSGGSATGTTVLNEADFRVSGSESSAVIKSGGREFLSSGSIASGDVVQSGGILMLSSGATVRDETVEAGGSAAFVGTVTNNLTLTTGSLASKTVEGGVTISSGGYLSLMSATVASGVTVSLGSGEVVSSLTVSHGATVNGAGELKASNFVAGSISGLTLLDAVMEIQSGGTASGLMVTGTELVVDAGGAETGATISVSDLLVHGSAAHDIIENQTLENISSGGVGSGDVVQSGGKLTVLAGGTAVNETVQSGGSLDFSGNLTTAFTDAGELVTKTTKLEGVTVSSGGTIDIGGATIASGATLTLAAGAEAGDLTVSSGGKIKGPGNLDGTDTVAGAISGVTIENYGYVTISSGGTASSVVVDGNPAHAFVAGLLVAAQGKANNTVALSGARVAILGTATGDQIEGAEEIVLLGGHTTGTVIFSGGLGYVSSGGLAAQMRVSSGGSETIEAGGAMSGVTLYTGGSLTDDGRVLITGAGTLAGALSGSGEVIETGGGDLVLRGSGASFDGHAIISGGTIELTTSGAIGTGRVVFTEPTSGSAVLQIDAADAPEAGGTFANVISNFSGAGENIDLRSIVFSSGATAAMSGSTLVLSDGGKTYKFKLGGSVGEAFSVAGDGHGGTQIAVGVAPAKVVAFAQAAAVFAPSDAANAALMSGGVTSSLALAAHATASAGAGHI